MAKATKSKAKKYQCVVVKDGEAWCAQIIRQVTSKKTKISKQKTGFTTEQEALSWGEATLLEFTATQSSSNQRHDTQRKKNDEIKRLRSSRRADKTAAQKEAKAALKTSIDSGSQDSGSQDSDFQGSGSN